MKKTGYLLLMMALLLAAGVILGLTAPSRVEVERSILIETGPEIIYPYLAHFENRSNWYPWYLADPEIVLEISGEPGRPGSRAAWEGNSQVGAGEETILAAEENRRVESRVLFRRPLHWEAVVEFRLEPEAAGTRVEWTYEGDLPFGINVAALLFNIEKAVGADMEQGLSNLKEVSEAAAERWFYGFEVSEVEFPPRTYLGIREEVPFAETEQFLAGQLRELETYLQEKGIPATGHPTGLFFRWDEATEKTWMAAALPVPRRLEPEENREIIEIPRSKALLVTYQGPYEGSAEAHMAIDAYLAKSGLEQISPVVEEYLVGPAEEPDSSKWLTRIYYLFK